MPTGMDPSLLATLRVHNPWLDHPDRQRELLARKLPEPYVPRRKRLDLRPDLLAVVNGSLRLDTEVDGVPVAYVRPWELSSRLTAS